MRSRQQAGFTIVELLIVIVVIAILAAITVVAYNGIQERAKNSAAQAAVSQGVKKLEAYKVQNNDSYPTNPSDAGISVSSDSPYTYTGSGNYYCLTATQSGVSYFSTNYSQAPTPGTCDGLIAWWPLNENVNDVGPNGLNGSGSNLTNAIGQNGKSGGAYSFNGTNSQITVANNALLNPVTAITVSAWATLAAAPTTEAQGIVSKDISGGIGNPPYVLIVNTTSVPSFVQVTSANASAGSDGTFPFSANNWYLLTGTFDGTTARLYVNGELQSSAARSDIATTTNVLRIGQQKAGTNRWFNGRIDDVRIYNRALSAAEVQQTYKGGAL